MKTFDDLSFKPHPVGNGTQGIQFFDNGYGISVVRFGYAQGIASYTSNDSEWEAAVLLGNEKAYSLCYSTPITDDVVGHLSDEGVSRMMKDIQALPKVESR
jgi:hypothetical protein